jgi:hypothetical protein
VSVKVRMLPARCAIVFMYSDYREYGHRRQRLPGNIWSLARDCDSPYPPHIFPLSSGSRAGCSGWKARHRTSLAAQQQRFARYDSNAD